MNKKPFEPNLKTPDDQLCKEELNKLNAANGQNPFAAEMHDESKKDIIWEAEQLAKSSGIYLEFDRLVKGAEKHWSYMIRIANPGGGPISKEQWLAYDDLAEKHCKNPYGLPSIRLTTRQTVQFHWISKQGVLDIVKTMAEKGMNSLNGCGDNTRNVMASPMSRFSTIFNGNDLAHKLGTYFQLPIEPWIKIFAIDPTFVRTPEKSFQYSPKLLNRKFKIGIGGVLKNETTGKLIADNSAEILTNDLAISPIIDNDQVTRFQLYVGGGQGERNGKPSTASLGQPLCIVDKDNLLTVCDAVVQVHQQWGDRENRFWARLKYVIKKQGVAWFRTKVEEYLNTTLELPNPNHDIGDRKLFFGWNKQDSNGLWAYGVFIENGRVIDSSPNGKVRTILREIIQKYPTEIILTANQDVLFTNIPENLKEQFENDLKSYGYGTRNGKEYSPFRLRSGACVGRDTCRLTYTDSEKFEPELLDELEALGWGNIEESIGITGCERQCFRPGTKTIGLVGTGMNRYMFKLFGDETGRFQGVPLISSDGEELHLRSVPREKVNVVIDLFLKDYTANKNDGESLGAYHRRVKSDYIIDLLKNNADTQELMNKPFNTDCVIV